MSRKSGHRFSDKGHAQREMHVRKSGHRFSDKDMRSKQGERPMTLRRAAIVSPIRTAVGKFGGGLASVSAGQLGAIILKALIERTKIDPSRVDDVVFSQGYGSGEAPAIGHWSWLAAGLPMDVPGYQLDRR